jgi:murein DD-endopeptidase MepM/ murein hydrolase activator NlpD
MMIRLLKRLPIALPGVVYALLAIAVTPVVYAGNTDPDAIWPLCGRIAESPPPGWNDTDGCPADRFGDAAYSDEPLSSTFGPRPLASENNRYDFHRGVDIATPTGTPFFAISDGVVRIAGNHSSYSDPLVSVRHFRDGEANCPGQGCYQSYYMHISQWVVNKDDTVVRGQLLGYTGASSSGFQHIHFEVRDAPAFDPYSSWSRDSIHPLGVVPYQAPNETSIVFNAVDAGDPKAVTADITVTSNRFDLVYLGLNLIDANGQDIPQDGSTPDANGYFVLPPFFDLEEANFQFSHKNSSTYPWESFGAGGNEECPYHGDHGVSYSAHVHLDAQHPDDYHEGLFNGLHVRTQKYWPSDVDDYRVDLEFLALQGQPACIEATALFAAGNSSTAKWGNCDGTPNQPPEANLSWDCQGLDCNFDGSGSSDPDGTIAVYHWDFGDGGSGAGSTINHSYPSAGDWLVTLDVTDNDGAVDSVAEWVTVTAPPAAQIDISLSTNKKGNRVTVRWSGATGNKVDIHRDGVRVTTTRNDGSWNDREIDNGTSYTYRVCEQNSTVACSEEAEF